MLLCASRVLCLFAIVSAVSVAQVAAQPVSPGGFQVDAHELPADFSGDLIVLTPITPDGDTLRFMTDTGGGANMIYAEAAERLGLATHGEVAEEGERIELTGVPAFEPERAIPSPAMLPPTGGQLMVREQWPEFFEEEGFLGRTWFAGRVWLFDYPGETIGQVVGLDRSTIPEEHRVTLGFQKDEDGRRTMHFPRITVEVAGEELDMLFDTGATTILSGEARDAIDGAGSGTHATSFIAESVFDTWRERNSDWRVIEGGDTIGDMPMIEVPEVTIAGHTVGPVWFAMRPDDSMHEYMSQWMDRRIDGALGGSALKYFRIVVDYPNAQAAFDVTEPEQ